MKLVKTIIAAMVAAPLAFGSLSALAKEETAPGANHKRGPHMMANNIFAGVNLTKEQKAQIQANLTKEDKKPTNLSLKQRPNKKEQFAKIFAGVNLTDAQKAKLQENLEKMPKRPQNKLGNRKGDASVPMILPELSEQQPVGAIK